TQPLLPLYATRRTPRADDSASGRVFWHITRRPAGWRSDRGTDVMISFSDRSGKVREPGGQLVSLRLTCFNGDLPNRLPFGQDQQGGDFVVDASSPVARIRAASRPSSMVPAILGKPVVWRLISALSLNYLSLTDGPEALRELLRLHNPGDTATG